MLDNVSISAQTIVYFFYARKIFLLCFHKWHIICDHAQSPSLSEMKTRPMRYWTELIQYKPHRDLRQLVYVCTPFEAYNRRALQFKNYWHYKTQQARNTCGDESIRQDCARRKILLRGWYDACVIYAEKK